MPTIYGAEPSLAVLLCGPLIPEINLCFPGMTRTGSGIRFSLVGRFLPERGKLCFFRLCLYMCRCVLYLCVIDTDSLKRESLFNRKGYSYTVSN